MKVIAQMKTLIVIIINLSLLGVVNAEDLKFHEDVHKGMTSLYCNEQNVLKRLKMNNEQCKVYIINSIKMCNIHIEKIPSMYNSDESKMRNKDKIDKSIKLFMNCLNKEVFKNKNRDGDK